MAAPGRLQDFVASVARYRGHRKATDLRLKRKRVSMATAVSVPLVVSVGSLAIMWAIGVAYGTNLAISGSVFAITSFAAAQLQASMPMSGRDVRVILASQGPYSRSRAQALYNVITDNNGWSCKIQAPPDVVNNLARWQEERLRDAVRGRVDAIVLENRSTLMALQHLIRQARNLGIYVAVMGDSQGDPRPAGIASRLSRQIRDWVVGLPGGW